LPKNGIRFGLSRYAATKRIGRDDACIALELRTAPEGDAGVAPTRFAPADALRCGTPGEGRRERRRLAVGELPLPLPPRDAGKCERAAIDLAPRSIYLLAGPSRTDREHSIPAVEALRYSIMFRNVREAT
jgi:hypothetical protein